MYYLFRSSQISIEQFFPARIPWSVQSSHLFITFHPRNCAWFDVLLSHLHFLCYIQHAENRKFVNAIFLVSKHFFLQMRYGHHYNMRVERNVRLNQGSSCVYTQLVFRVNVCIRI